MRMKTCVRSDSLLLLGAPPSLGAMARQAPPSCGTMPRQTGLATRLRWDVLGAGDLRLREGPPWSD